MPSPLVGEGSRSSSPHEMGEGSVVQPPTPHPFVLVGRSVSPSPTRREDTIEGARLYLPADFGNATIISSSIRAPGDESWLMHTVVEAGSQSPK